MIKFTKGVNTFLAYQRYTYFSLLEGFFSTRILRVRVQGNGRTNDDNPPSRQNRQSREQILKQLEPDLGSDSSSQDTQKLQNKHQKNDHIYEMKVINKKERENTSSKGCTKR